MYLGISTDTLRKIVRESGIDYKTTSWKKGLHLPKKDYQFVDKQWLLDNWVGTNSSAQQLSNQYNVPLGVIEYRIQSYQLRKPYKYSVNIEKLHDLSDTHLWYLAGLVATDGYLPKGKNAIHITLCGQSEFQLLNDIVDYYQVGSGVVTYKENTHTIRIAYDGLNQFFNKEFGITDGSKTFCVSVPQHFPNEDCAKAFIRGCFDGDGYIGKSNYTISLCTASIDFVKGIKEIISKYTHQNMPMRVNKYATISSDYKKGRIILDWVYSLNNCFRLNRKYDNYNKLKIQSEHRYNVE